MTRSWTPNTADEAEAAIAAKFADAGIITPRSMVTGYLIAAGVANFEDNGDITERCAWIPSAGLSLDDQITLLEDVLANLQRQRQRDGS